MRKTSYRAEISWGILLAALVLALQVAEAGGHSDWSFRLVPYLWTTRINGVVGPSANPSNVDVSFKDLIQNADFAISGLFEATYKDDWTFLGEGMYSEISTGGTGPEGVKADIEMDYAFLTLAAGKRVMPNVGVYAGARGIYSDTAIKLSAGPVQGPGASLSEDWWDPIIGFHVTGTVNDKLSTVVSMDVGGFGVNSDITYQVMANLVYRFDPTWSAIFGYRLLDIEYDKDGFVFDARQDGLNIGLGISW